MDLDMNDTMSNSAVADKLTTGEGLVIKGLHVSVEGRRDTQGGRPDGATRERYTLSWGQTAPASPRWSMP